MDKVIAIDKNGNSYGVIEIGSKLGGGGEGDVYNIASMNNIIYDGQVWNKKNAVAKLYFDPEPRKDKVTAMLNSYPHNITWAFATLYKNNKFIGFLMPKLDFKTFDTWGNYSNNRTRPKEFTYPYAFIASLNLASALKGVHDLGHVIGDLNESNQLIGKTAEVFIVDADSAQIKDGNKVYPSLVGKPEYTAPELIGKNFRDVKRTPQTDIFAFSVLVWQLLSGGVHPVQGIPPKNTPDKVPPNLTISDKIKAGFYPALGGKPFGYLPPVASPTSAIPSRIRDIIKRGLSVNPNERPSLDEFINTFTIVGQNMTQCLDDDQHYWDKNDYSVCPWCIRDNKNLPNAWGGGDPIDLTSRIGQLKAHNQIVLPTKPIIKNNPVVKSKPTVKTPKKSSAQIVPPASTMSTNKVSAPNINSKFNTNVVNQNTPLPSNKTVNSNKTFTPPISTPVIPIKPPVRKRPPRRRPPRINKPKNPETASSLRIFKNNGVENYEPNVVGLTSIKLFFFGWLYNQPKRLSIWWNNYNVSPSIIGLFSGSIYSLIIVGLFSAFIHLFNLPNIFIVNSLLGLLPLVSLLGLLFFIVSSVYVGNKNEFSDKDLTLYTIYKTLIATIISPLQWLIFYGRFTYVFILRLFKQFSFKNVYKLLSVLAGWGILIGLGWLFSFINPLVLFI